MLAAIVVGSILAGATVFGGAAAADTDTVVVGAGNTDSETIDYNSIQNAIDKADGNDTIDTIRVRNGTYDERVVVDTAVTLVAENDSGATIRYAPSSVTGQPTVKVTADGATVDGFQVSRTAASGRDADASVPTAFTQGIRVSASNVIITDNTVVGQGFDDGLNNKGVMVIDDESGDATGETVTNVTVSNNEIAGFAGPLSFVNAYGGTISDIELAANDPSGYYYGPGITVGERAGEAPAPYEGTDAYEFEATSTRFPDTTTYFDSEAAALAYGANGTATGADVVVTAPSGDYIVGPEMSIQAAINATVREGDTIRIRSGTFTEQLQIRTNVTITGAGAGQTTIQSPASLSNSFTYPDPGSGSVTGYGVVTVTDATANISSLTVDGAGQGETNRDFFGIAYVTASGTVDNVTVTGVRESPLSGTQHGVAVGAFSQGTDQTVEVRDSRLVGYQKNGFVARGDNLTGRVIDTDVIGEGPTSVIGQNGIQIGGSAVGVIRENEVRGHIYTPSPTTTQPANIILYNHGGDAETVIRDNTLTDGTAGIAIAGPKTVTIEGNTFGNSSWHVLDYNAPPTLEASLNASEVVATNTFPEGAAYRISESGTANHSVYGDLQIALDGGAGDSGVTEEETVKVTGGTYDAFGLSTSNVTIEAAEGTTPTVEAQQSRITVPSQTTVRGLDIDLRSGTTIYAKGDGIAFEDNDIAISGTSNYGLRLGDANNSVVENNTFTQQPAGSGSNVLQGVLVSGSRNVSVTNNNFSGPDSGIAVLVSNNGNNGDSAAIEIANNDITGWAYGTFLYADEDTITDVTITDNRIAGTTAVPVVADDRSGGTLGTINTESTADAIPAAIVGDNEVRFAELRVDGAVVAATVAPAVDTIVVNPDSTIGDFDSIQTAVEAANPGDTVVVERGTYTERVVIEKNVTVAAESGATLTRNSAPGGYTGNSYLIVRGAETNATVTGLTLAGPFASQNTAGILVTGEAHLDAGNLRLEQMYVPRNGEPSGAQRHDAIVVGRPKYNNTETTASLTLADSVIDEFGKTAVTVKGDASTAVIDNVTITGSGLLESPTDDDSDSRPLGQDTILLVNNSQAVVEGSLIQDVQSQYGTGELDAGVGVSFYGQAEAIVRNTTFRNVSDAVAIGAYGYEQYGFATNGPGTVVYENNRIVDSQSGFTTYGFGPEFQADDIVVADSRLRNNTIRKSLKYGFAIGGGDATNTTAVDNSFAATPIPVGDATDGLFDAATLIASNDFERAVVNNPENAPRNATIRASIQPTVENATAGTTIEVYPGTYTEAVTVGVENATLQAMGPRAVTTINSTTATTVTVGAANVTVAGFTLTAKATTVVNNGGGGGNPAYDGFRLDDSSVTQYGSRANLAAGVRFTGTGASDAVVEDSRIERTRHGILVQQASNITVDNTTLQNNYIARDFDSDSELERYGNGIKIVARSGDIANFTVRDSQISGNGGLISSGGKAGITLVEQPDGSGGYHNITDVEVHRNSIPATDGFGLVATRGTVNNNAPFNDGAFSSQVNATRNWWGSLAGPGGAGPGDGANVSENVTFEPWLNAPPGEAPAAVAGPNFTVDIDRIGTGDNPVGEPVPFSVTVENTGDVPGVRTLNLTQGGDQSATVELALRGGEQATTQLSYRPTASDLNGQDERSVTFTADTGDDTATTSVTLISGVSFAVTDTTVSETEVAAGESITVTATINNTDAEGDTQSVWLELDGQTVAATQRTIASEGTGTVTFTYLPAITEQGEELNFSVQTSAGSADVTNVTVRDPAEFAVTDVTFPSGSPTAGTELSVDATIENVGGQADERPVRLTLGGSTVAAQSLTIPSNETADVTLTAPTTLDDAGTRELAVQTYNDSQATQLTLQEPAELRITDVTPTPASPVAGTDDIGVDVTVENVGDEPADQSVTLGVEGTDVASTDVSVPGGTTQTVTLTTPATTSDVGTRSLVVETDDDAQQTDITVREPADLSVSIDGVTDPVVADQGAIQLEATVENTGDVTGTTTVELRADSTTRDTATVSVAGDASTTVTLQTQTTAADTGDVSLVATAGSSSANTTVTVLEPPEEALFRVSNLSVTDEVLRRSGTTVQVTGDVTNIGDLEDTQTLTLAVGGETRNTSTVTLAGGASTTVSFEVPSSSLVIGDRTVALTSADWTVTTTTTVREPVPPTVTVSVTDVPDTLAGPTNTVNVTVENTGDSQAAQTIDLTLMVDGATVATASRDVTLAGGATQQLALDLDVTGEPRAGVFTGRITAASANETDAVTTDVDFGTIASGIDAASETVLLAPGTYRPQTLVVDEDVTLQGSNAVVNASGAVGVRVTAAGATVDNLRVTNASTAVQVAGTDATLRRLRVTNTSGAVQTGIDVNADGVEIAYTTIQRTAEGINTTAAATTVRNSVVSDATYGINLTDGAAGATIRRSKLLNSEVAVYADAGRHVMRQNNIERNDVAIDADRPSPASVTGINATQNWWGRPAGPRDDEILSPVVVEPFLTAPNEDAEYEITNVDVAGSVTAGETIDVTTTVKNVGGTAGSTNDQRIELVVSGTEEDQTSRYVLGADGTVTDRNLSYTTTQLAAGDTLTLAVRTGDDTATRTVNVLAPASFTTDTIDAPATADAERSFTVTATVNNTGATAGTTDVSLALDGRTADTVSGVSVAGGSDTSVTLSHTPASQYVGTDVPITVVVDGIERSETVAIEPEPSPGGGGGGGGDGPAAVAETEPVTAPLVDGQAEADLSPEAPVEQLAVDLSASTTGGSVSVEPLSARPEAVPESPATETVALVDIAVPDEQTETQATLEFTVDTEALGSTAPEDLVVYHYSDGSWSALETQVVTTNQDAVTVEATTPGFSVFAIGTVQDQQTTPTAVPDDGEQTATPSGDGLTATPAAGTASPSDIDGTEPGGPTQEPGGFPLGPLVIALLAGGVIVAGYILTQRQ